MAHTHDHHGHDHRGHGQEHGKPAAAAQAHDHRSGHDHSHGATDQRRVLIAAALTGGFMVAEACAGFWTGSLALVADAGHMLTDTIALTLAWYAFRLGERQATARLTYGFGRVKTLVAYTNGLTILAIALWILYEAAMRFLQPAPVLAGPMLWVAVTGLAVNAACFAVLHGGDRGSLNMRGAVLHVLGDMLGSAAAIAAALIILATGWTAADPILSVLVAVLIVSTAWRLMREAAHVLLEGVPASLDRDAIAADLADAVSGLREVHHMHVWSMDGSRTMATLHACLEEGVDAHGAVLAIKARLATRHGIEHATVEPEFAQCADAPQHLH